MSPADETGSAGEELAARYLKDRGYRILDRNYVCSLGEVDLIVREKDGTVVFVEVKTRTAESGHEPAEAVLPHKRAKVIRAAKHYLAQTDPGRVGLRFDVVSVSMGPIGQPEILHFEDAYRPPPW